MILHPLVWIIGEFTLALKFGLTLVLTLVKSKLRVLVKRQVKCESRVLTLKTHLKLGFNKDRTGDLAGTQECPHQTIMPHHLQ